MLHQKLRKVNKGVNLLCAHGRAGQTQLHLWRRISQSEMRNSAAAESEGGQKFLPPNPLPFCPPERSVWRAKRAVSSVQKRFGFRQTNAPELNFQEFCRLIQPREARQRTETLARRARRGSPSAGSKSLAILSICFAQLKTNNINL
jgi:hypothetical protein